MVRHALEGEFLYSEMRKLQRSVADSATPFTGGPFTTIDNEIAAATAGTLIGLGVISAVVD
jgi:hypothetical protein